MIIYTLRISCTKLNLINQKEKKKGTRLSSKINRNGTYAQNFRKKFFKSVPG